MKKLGTLIVALFTLTAVFAKLPTTITRTLEWQKETNVIPYEDAAPVPVSMFDGAYYDENYPSLPVFTERFSLNGFGDVKAVFANVVYEPLQRTPSADDAQLSDQIPIHVSVEKERQSYFAKVSLVPIRKVGEGQYERLVSFTLRFTFSPKPLPAANRNGFTSTSVLANGDVYKLAVTETGVHKLDYDFLKNQMGIPVDNIDPRTLKLYGNGGGVVPELVGAPRADDLVENAIFIQGEADGKFDAGDYILFYGEGATVWEYDEENGIFNFPQNFYDTKNYYFIKIGSGNGLRLQDRASATGSTYTTTSFDDFRRYERDLYNLMHDWPLGQGSGQNFYGDYFKVKLDEDYSDQFTVDNLLGNEPAHLGAVVAGRIKSGTTGKFSVTVNGNKFTSSDFTPTPGGSTDTYASTRAIGETFAPGGSQFAVKFEFSKGNDASNEAWLDYIQLNFRRQLSMAGSQMSFRDTRSIGQPVGTFRLGNANGNLEVWDITNPLVPLRQAVSLAGNELNFSAPTSELREFIVFDKNNGLLSAEAISTEKVANQNIHGIGEVDLVIVYHKDFQTEAERLAEHRRTFSGLQVAVVDIEQLYNEFSSGRVDASAIRDLCRMLAERNPERFRYCLLFGDGSFDPRDIYKLGGNYVPVYETISSTSPIQSYPTDDYFALLSEGEGANINTGALDIGVGRLPVKDADEARAAVDKIIAYDTDPATYRDWRNRVAFVGDDADTNLHTKQADDIAVKIGAKYPNLNMDKVYLGAFPHVATSGGARVPLATEGINNNVFKGLLAMVYLGHGGTKGWAQKRVLKIEDILSWNNFENMPLIITATCSFSGFDNPAFTTAGELCFLNEKGGAIALFTTVRPVFASSNKELTEDALDTLFSKFGTEIPAMGEVLRLSKNLNGSPSNSRKFLMLGDPSQKLALPNHNVVTTTVDGEPIGTGALDTIRALQKVTIGGEVRDDFGNVLTGFNGVVYPTIFDKSVTYETLVQPPSYFPAVPFKLQKNIIFKGRASVSNGKFSFTFVVPKDIDYNFGNCKVSYYAADEADRIDAAGNYQEIVVGGTDPNALADNQGPRVEVFMNNENFVFGGITSPDPVLLVTLEDDNGINVVGNAIGHDLSGVMDKNSQNTYILNDFYEAALDDHTRGEVRYPLSAIPEGRHEIKVTAWDIANNPAEGLTEFVVVTSEEMALKQVLNYPNPFTTSTCFMFEHNQTGVELDVMVQIYSVSGRLIKTLNERIISEGYRLGSDNCIRWDGRDDYGDPLAKGVYLYKVKVQSSNTGEIVLAGESDFEKLVILK